MGWGKARPLACVFAPWSVDSKKVPSAALTTAVVRGSGV